MKKQVIAMLLAGGQGSRLGVLTKDTAKPAVPFGGKYRIIDFALSNCANSAIDVVGVLTQYQPLELNTYISSGAPWDMDRMNGGIYVLPPYVKSGEAGDWYHGTANAIYQNIPFIDQYDPDYVVILSGDHIYRMDYAATLAYHKRMSADATIAVIEVPWEEASRFGIMNMDGTGRITEFAEKPRDPKSNKASMGVYIFTWKVLREYLEQDSADENSTNDFGKNIIPRMLDSGAKLYAYNFGGYWKDVGTIESLWQANMDLLDPDTSIHITDSNWRIYTRSARKPPHYVSDKARVSRSVISEGSAIHGAVRDSVIFTGVTIEPGAIVEDSVIMPNTVIGQGCVVKRAIVAENVNMRSGCVVGTEDGDIAVVGKDAVLHKDTIVEPGAQIDAQAIL